MARRTVPDDETRLPRGSFFKWTGPQMLRIGMTASLLILIVVVRKPCSDSVGKMVTSFGSGSDGSAVNVMPKPGNVDVPVPPPQHYEVMTGDMSEAEIKAAMARANAAAGFGSGSGSGSGSSAAGVGSGSSAGSGSAR